MMTEQEKLKEGILQDYRETTQIEMDEAVRLRLATRKKAKAMMVEILTTLVEEVKK